MDEATGSGSLGGTPRWDRSAAVDAAAETLLAQWRVGEYLVFVGASLKDIRLSGELSLTQH